MSGRASWTPSVPGAPAAARRDLASGLLFPAALWALLAVALLDVFLRLGDGSLDSWRLLSSDALYLPTLYRDLFEEGGRWASWRLTPAPYVFPDMAVYFALNALLGSFERAMTAYAVLQIAALVFALRYLLGSAAPGRGGAEDQGLAVGSVAALLLIYVAGGFWPLEAALQSAFHFSLVPLAAVSLGLALRSRQGSPAASAQLGVLAALATASDSLFVAAFTVPAGLALLALAWLEREGWRPALRRTLGALALATIAGLAAGWWFSLYVNLGFLRPRPELWLSGLGHFAEALRDLFGSAPLAASLWLGLLLGTAAVVALQRRRWTAPASPFRGLYALCLYALLAAVINSGAVVLNGLFLDSWCWRYLIVPVVMLFSAGVFAALRGPYGRRWPWLGLAACGLVAVGWGASIVAHPWRSGEPHFSGLYPPLVECLDRNQERYGLGWGLSDYWSAKSVSMLSRRGLRVRQVFHDGSVMHWINNLDWFLDRRGPHSNYNFVIAYGLDMAAFESRFGPPRETFRCPNVSPLGPDPHEVEIRVYGDALDAPLRAAMDPQVSKARGARSLRW